VKGGSLRPYRVSALYEAHRALGATLRDEGDWRVPDHYGSPGEEVTRALAAVGLADASACGKLCVRGDGVEAVLAKAAAIERFTVGAAERVFVEGLRVLALRPADDELLLLSPVAAAETVRDVVAGAAAGLPCAHLTDVTSALAVVDVVGPRGPELLARLSPLDLALVPVLGVVQGEVARVHATVIRLDRPAVPTFRLLVAREYGASAWDALHEAGHDLGLVPVGAAARARLDDGDVAEPG
jgi:heterotetrameric sarcosine oxidase gamma subunit